MTPKPPPKEMAAWLRRLEAADAKHKTAKDALSEVIADARNAGVPLTTIEKHVSYSREWARKLADEVDQRRAATEPALPATEG